MKVRGPSVKYQGRVPVSRGTITSFSNASRKRLIETLASINRDRVRFMPLFVTLTYPEVYSEEGQTWKRHLDSFLKALARAYPGCSAVWRLEFQKRGAPHYHLLVFGLQWLDAKWLARTWYRIVASGDEKHLKAGTQVKRVRSWRGVMSYASKYMAKTGGAPSKVEVGRYWGIFNRVAIPTNIIIFPITLKSFYTLKRAIKRWSSNARQIGGGANRWKGITLLAETSRLLPLLRVCSSPQT